MYIFHHTGRSVRVNEFYKSIRRPSVVIAHALYGNNFARMEHYEVNLCSTKQTPFSTLQPHPDEKRSRTIGHKMDGFLIPSTFSKLGLLTVKGWYYLGMMLVPGKLLEIQFNEPSSDFRCDVKVNIDGKDSIRGMCFNQYQKQNNKLGLPLSVFITFNFLVIHVVAVIYSQFVKSTVRELERRHQDAQQRSCRFSCAYVCHLTVTCVLRIIFIAFLELELFYPKTFPANFTCSIEERNQTKSANSVHCFNERAGDKNIWIETVKYANGFFALVVLLEIVSILSGAIKGIIYPQAQKDFSSAIQTLKEDCVRGTEQPSDLKQPFRRPNPGEGYKHDLKIDEIYVHVAIHEGRAHHYFAKDLDRWEQLREYPPNAKHCHFAKPEDIIDKEHGNVLAVGRPGIGKTSLSTKMLRLWATGKAFNENHHEKSHFNVVFLVKFRRFNDNAELSLRELLARAETVQRLDDSVLEFVQNEPRKVLFIFDGLDEYSRKKDIIAQNDGPTYESDVEKKMPVYALYNKLAAGELLRGASILTTTRPTAVKYVKHVNFQRTVEICGFTSTNVEDYVQRFSHDFPGAKEKIWEHIKSNTNIFSLCYIPVNCFLICHCLLQIFLSRSYQQLPTKITDIYQMIVKMVFFNHNRESWPPEELEELKETHMYEPFENFPEGLQELLNRLGEIAFKGIKEGTLLFESREVKGLEDCGLLHKLPDVQSQQALNDPPKSQFCFTHLTVQEFFAAKYLVDTESSEKIGEFVHNHINDGRWQVVLQFVAGLLKSSSDIFIKLLPELTGNKENPASSERKTLTCWPARKDKYLAVQVCKCLYEINDEQQPVLQNKIEKIKFNAVDFSSCSLAPIDVAAVLHFLENAEEVLFIDLFRNALGDLGANQVKKFLVNRERKLKSLDLRDNKLTDNAAKDLGEALKHSNCKLESLDLGGNNFANNAAKDLGEALKHSNCKLESLYLVGNNFANNAAKDLGEALKHSNCKLESLYLVGNNFANNAAKDLGEALKHSNCKLESLDLSGNNLTDNAAKDLGEALKHSNCKLESLHLSYNNLTANAAKDLGQALKHSNCKLQSLDLNHNKLTDNAAKDLGEALKHSNCKLESLDLRGNQLTDNAAKDLGEALKHSNCKLESLDLRHNKLTDNAAKDLGEALKHSNCKLESLDLRHNKLTDNAAKDLGEALKHSNCKLESLDLSFNKLTDNAAKDLGEALKHSNCKLESLDLSFNSFTWAGEKYLTDAGKQSSCMKRLKHSHNTPFH